jgi:fatty acid desaturase
LRHLHLATPRDPDRQKHACFNKADRIELLAFLSGLASVGHAAKAVFVTRGRANSENRTAQSSLADGYTLRDFVLLAGWLVFAAGGLSWLIGWWAYPVLWLFPVYTFMYLADNFRSFAEHSQPEGDQTADRHRLITYISNPLERMLVAPMHMNYHTVTTSGPRFLTTTYRRPIRRSVEILRGLQHLTCSVAPSARRPQPCW